MKADGTIRPVGDRDADIRFELGAGKLVRLRKGLPDIPFAMSGNYVESREKLELKDVKSRLGKTEFSGWASMTRDDKRHVEAEVTTPRLDLTPFLKKRAGQRREDAVNGWAERARPPSSRRKNRRANTSSARSPGARRAWRRRCECAFRRSRSDARARESSRMSMAGWSSKPVRWPSRDARRAASGARSKAPSN